MVSRTEKAQCVLCFHESKSPIYLQRVFQICHGCDRPDAKKINQCKEQWDRLLGDLPRSRTPNVDLVSSFMSTRVLKREDRRQQ